MATKGRPNLISVMATKSHPNLAGQINEMATKSHPNLVRLLGYCFDMSYEAERMEQIVVYEFMANGDLDRWIGAARGVVSAASLVAAGDVAALKDPHLQAPDDLVLRMARLALSCTAMPTASRPGMSRVLAELLLLKEEFFGEDEDRMAARIDHEIESSQQVDFSLELARIEGIQYGT
ncbi:unnamed protein product [Closterium sp. NIES-65]|nr:unnamed protein product [Closterium sp. NIES-65]